MMPAFRYDEFLDILEAVLEASIGITPPSKLVPAPLRQVIARSITSERTRQLLRSIYENGRDQALPYIFGLVDGRKVPLLELLEPAHQLWPSKAAQQNARKLLDRSQATLRTNFFLATATHDEEVFLRFLFTPGLKERWRKGTVDRLAAWRGSLALQIPEQAAALSELTMPALGRTLAIINDFRFRQEISAGSVLGVRLFTSVYAALRYVGLFSHQGAEVADILNSASSTLPRDSSAEVLMLQRALERPLHLLDVSEGWETFLSRLLDWLQDPRGDGAGFAAYTCCYYLDSLDTQSWQGMVDPFSIERAWTKEALDAVLEESYKNLGEALYRAPHHTAINTLRALNYLRAHPDLRLSRREWNLCLHLARVGIAAARGLSHLRASEARQWSERLEAALLRESTRAASGNRLIL